MNANLSGIRLDSFFSEIKKEGGSMKVKAVSIALALAMLLALVAGCTVKQTKETGTPEEQQTVTITDSAGREVEVPQSPERVVVLYSQIPIAMKAIGVDIDKHIIGLSEYAAEHDSTLFPGLTKKPTVGPHHFDVDYEKLIDLEPQIVMTTPFSVKRLHLEDKLKSTDIKVVALDFDIESFRQTVQTLGKTFNKEERAREYADFWLNQLEVVKERVSKLSPDEKIRCYGEGTQQAYKAASSGTSLHEMIDLAGGVNIAADLEERSPEVDPEWVIKENPEVIFKFPMGAKYQGGFAHTKVEPFSNMKEEISGRPGFNEIKAVKEDNIYILSRDIVGGAFENIGVLYVAKILYPELFEGIDPEAQLKEMVEEFLGLNFEDLKGVFVYPWKATITDSAGRVVEVPQPLERVAVWNGDAAEVIRALGAEDKICAIDKYMAKDDYYWPELKGRPQIGSPWSIDYEKIIKVDPQVLITYSKYPSGTELEEKLEPAGVKVIRLDCYGLEDEIRDIKTLGVLLDREEKAGEFANFLQSKIELVDERVKEIKREEKKRVYWELGSKDYYTVAEGSATHKRLCRAGGINVFAGMGTSYSEIDPEKILMKEPDVIIKGPHGSKVGGYLATNASDMKAKRDEMMNRPGWSDLKAVKNGEVYIFGDDLMGAKGPIRLCHYAKLFYPDRFKDVDVEAFHKEYLEKYQGLKFKGIYVYPCPWKAED